MEFTKLSEVEVVETANDTDKVLIEQNGEIKRVPKTEVGGGGGGLIISTTDMATFTANMTLTEAIEALNKQAISCASLCMSENAMVGVVPAMMFADMSAQLGAECIMIVFSYPEEMQFFWTANGISMEPPA